jgi:purine nucleosidase/pyrimidine-specific ribonucleoside hydrolase
MAEPVIIDTDPGIDDALALLLAFRSPELEVKAITTVSGNVPLSVTTRNAFTVLSLLNLDRNPPVAAGASKPLEKAPVFAPSVHGDDGLGGIYQRQEGTGPPRYAPPEIVLSGRDAVEEILFQISANEPQPLTLITLGPLTNVAQAIERDRVAMSRLRRIVIMGGAFTVPGNVTPAAEFNFYVDPLAASIVFNAGIPLTAVGLDVTRKVRITREMVDEEIAPCKTAITEFIDDCTSELFRAAMERAGEASSPLHDPLAVGAVIDPSLVSTEALYVEIERRGECTDGMALADRRPIQPSLKNPPNADVCLEVDGPRFLSLFLERVCG